MAGPPLTCWVGWPGPLVASVPETDALRYPARNLVSSTPFLLTYFSSDSSTISTSTLLGVGAYKLAQPSKRAGRLSVKTKRWLFFLGLSNQRMPIPPLMTPRRKSKNFPMWIERKLGIDIDPSAYPECCQSSLAQGSPHSNFHYDRTQQ
ncbi:hypothetical protein BDE02_T002900 [Populus trichocarpa]|nr:hypothetical protein BDE02_T002900 [Populus trichocarpa]